MTEKNYNMAAELVGNVLVRPFLSSEIDRVEGNERISRWIAENPPRFASILKSFDGLIASWNQTDFDSDVNKCASTLQESLQRRSLPPLLPDNPTISDLRGLYDTVRSLAWGMVRGQLPDDGGLRYKFHMQPHLQDEALVIGALFHAYEIQIGVQDPKLAVKLKSESGLNKNYVLDGLVEHALSLETEGPIFKAITGEMGQGGLDWVAGYPAFTKRLQQSFSNKVASAKK